MDLGRCKGKSDMIKKQAVTKQPSTDEAREANSLAAADDIAQSARKAEAALIDMRREAARVQADHNLTANEFAAVLTKLTINSISEPSLPPDPLPTTAPELWAKRDLNKRETAADFVRRVYGKWLDAGLERKDIAQLDPPLYKALSMWLTRHPDDPIASALPPQSDRIDEAIEHLSARYSVDFLRKLGYAIDTRMRRQKNFR